MLSWSRSSEHNHTWAVEDRPGRPGSQRVGPGRQMVPTVPRATFLGHLIPACTPTFPRTPQLPRSCSELGESSVTFPSHGVFTSHMAHPPRPQGCHGAPRGLCLGLQRERPERQSSGAQAQPLASPHPASPHGLYVANPGVSSHSPGLTSHSLPNSAPPPRFCRAPASYRDWSDTALP